MTKKTQTKDQGLSIWTNRHLSLGLGHVTFWKKHVPVPNEPPNGPQN